MVEIEGGYASMPAIGKRVERGGVRVVIFTRKDTSSFGLSRSREDAAQHLLAFQQTLTREFGAPVTLYFLKVADRYFDRSLQINFKISFTFGSSLTKPDDFSTQRSTPRIIG
jgi:hypothetical protein